jgi:hypothetical protein
MSGQQHQVPRRTRRWDGETPRPWSREDLDQLLPLARQGRVDGAELDAMAVRLERSRPAVTVRVSALRRQLRRAGEAIAPGRGAFPPALVAEIAALAEMRRAPLGAIAALAEKYERSVGGIKEKLRALRDRARDGGAALPLGNERAWTEAEDARVRAVVVRAKLRTLPRGTLPRLAAELRRSPAAVSVRVSQIRRALLAARDGKGAEAPVACVGPAHDGRAAGQHLDVSSLDLALAVHDPRTVAPTAGAARAAAPAGSSRWKDNQHAQILRREQEAAHPPEQVKRRCSSCRVPFIAPSRFRFRCDGCLHTHKTWTGYDA